MQYSYRVILNFRIVSEAAAQVMVSGPPIDLLAEKRKEIYSQTGEIKDH